MYNSKFYKNYIKNQFRKEHWQALIREKNFLILVQEFMKLLSKLKLV